jgi:hypothetical protein
MQDSVLWHSNSSAVDKPEYSPHAEPYRARGDSGVRRFTFPAFFSAVPSRLRPSAVNGLLVRGRDPLVFISGITLVRGLIQTGC